MRRAPSSIVLAGLPHAQQGPQTLIALVAFALFSSLVPGPTARRAKCPLKIAGEHKAATKGAERLSPRRATSREERERRGVHPIDAFWFATRQGSLIISLRSGNLQYHVAVALGSLRRFQRSLCGSAIAALQFRV